MYIHIMEYYATEKMNELKQQTAIKLNLTSIMWREEVQEQCTQYHIMNTKFKNIENNTKLTRKHMRTRVGITNSVTLPLKGRRRWDCRWHTGCLDSSLDFPTPLGALQRQGEQGQHREKYLLSKAFCLSPTRHGPVPPRAPNVPLLTSDTPDHSSLFKA